MTQLAAKARPTTKLSDELRVRLARAEGQIRGVTNMVECERPVIDVLTQLGAVHGALDKVVLVLIDEQVRSILDGTAADGASPESSDVDDLMKLIGRSLST